MSFLFAPEIKAALIKARQSRPVNVFMDVGTLFLLTSSLLAALKYIPFKDPAVAELHTIIRKLIDTIREEGYPELAEYLERLSK